MAKQIDIMGFSNLNLGVHCDFHYQTYNLLTKAGAEALHISALLPAYRGLVEQETGIVRRQTAYVSTVSLKTQDKVRDSILGVIMQIINAHLTTPIAAKLASAQWLDAVVSPYRNIRGHDYRSETREVAGLLSVLASEAASAHIATLHLTEEVATLAQYNAAFEVAQAEKLQEEVERLPQKDTDTDELRKQVDAKYAEIIQTMNAYAIVQPTEAIESFIAQMNALISLTRPGTSSGSGTSDGGTSDGEDNGSADSGGDTNPEPTPNPNPNPDTGGGGDDNPYEDEDGGLAG